MTAEFFGYVAASAAGLSVDFGLYTSLTEFAHWHYLASAVAGFSAGVITVYAISVFFVFRERRFESSAQEFLVFAAIGLAGLALTEMILYGCTSLAHFDYRLSKVISAGVVFLFNFSCRKVLLFSRASL